MPGQMFEHLRNRGGALDFADTKTLFSERDTECNVSKVPKIYFNRVEKTMRGLTRAGINSDLNERRDMALLYFKTTGEFDAAVHEWEAKPAADKTWVNIKNFTSTEYAKENKQNKLTAKQFKANSIKEQAEATEELINALTDNHTRQMKTHICSMTETMKEMTTLVKTDNKSPTNANNRTNEKKINRQESQKRFRDAPLCKHRNRKHPDKAENECWELESNASSCPTNWKSNKNT
jgi:hypothetical protein